LVAANIGIVVKLVDGYAMRMLSMASKRHGRQTIVSKISANSHAARFG
jgi:hypothetical protein